MEKPFEVRDLRIKEKFSLDDRYLNGYARLCKPYATAVYLSLCRHADKEQKCWPSRQKIAEEHSISERQVDRSIKILEGYKIIAVERLGKKLNNRYYLLDKSEWTDRQLTPDSQSTHPQTDRRLHSKDTHSKDTQERIPNIRSACPNILEGHKGCIEFIDSLAEIKNIKTFTNYQKQIGTLHKLLRAGRTFEEINKIVLRFQSDSFLLDKGWDMATVVSYLDRGSK